MKNLMLASVAILLFGCATTPKSNLHLVNLCMSKTEVMQIMGVPASVRVSSAAPNVEYFIYSAVYYDYKAGFMISRTKQNYIRLKDSKVDSYGPIENIEEK